MPIVGNRAYNDPAIGAAFQNIASLFAPPSAQDTAAYATAKAKSEEAARLADFYRQAIDPNTDYATLDRYAIGAGAYNPTQSYRAVEMGDATTRRGQDIESGDRRYGADKSALASMYGADRGYAASTENNVRDNARIVETNAADNVRALQANDADNARALTDRQMQEDGALARLYAAPVTVAQGARVYLPAQTAAATGLAPQLDGTAAPLNESQALAQTILAMPEADRDRIVRDKLAPTETQVQGQNLRGLVDSGALSQNDLVASIMGEQTPVEAIGPEGKPVFMSPGEAVRTGAQPVQNKSSDPAPKVENWIGPDGTGGIAVFDRATNQYVDTSTKQPLPAGSRTYTGQLQGGAEATGFGKTTEAQDRNAYAATMAEAPTDRLLKAFDTGQLPTTSDYVVFNLMSKVPAAAAPALVGQMSESGQTFYQDLRTALPFQLMTQSGAAVTEQEYERKLLELIPVPGEAAAVTKAKRENFATYLKAVRGVSGAAYDKIHAGGGITKPALPSATAEAPALSGPVRVASPDEARKLPSGTAIILPDGSEGRVP